MNPIESVFPLECGQRSKAHPGSAYRIVDGQSRGPGRWPWHVGLYRSMRQRYPYCGGTLIQPDIVLTAAHCTPNIGEPVKLGDYDLGQDEKHEKISYIAQVRIHEDFHWNTHRNDIALIQLSGSVELRDGINTACLPNASIERHRQCYVLGWGRTRIKRQSETLMEAKVPVVDHRFCKIRFKGWFTQKMLCAGFPSGGADACEGDSGGPLLCEKQGKFYVHGIISWGYGCGRLHTPGVYTDVHQYVDWIKVMTNMDR